MYANLKVHIREPNGHHDSCYAWAVVMGANSATIRLDDNDGNGNYPVEAGDRVVDLSDGTTLTVEADF